MKVYKFKEYPDKKTFLTLVNACREYSRKRRAAENIPPENFPALVMRYAAILDRAEQTGTEPEELEFVDLTYEEYQDSLRQQKKDEEKRKAEKDAIAQRIKDIEKSITDVEFREIFIRREVYSAGYSLESITWAVGRHLAGIEGQTAYLIEIENKRGEIEQEIRAAANSKGVSYVEN